MVNNFKIIISFIFFLSLSIWINSSNLFISSFDSQGLIDKEPQTVIWKDQVICTDCNKDKLITNDNIQYSKTPPKTFTHIGDFKVPLLFQVRTGGFPYLIQKSIIYFLGVSQGLFWHNFLLSLISLCFLFLAIRNIFGDEISKNALFLFSFFPLFSFFYPLWIETQWAIFLFSISAFLFSTTYPSAFLLAGICFGLAIHAKNAAIVFLIPLLFIFKDSFNKQRFQYFISSLLPLLFIQFLIMYFHLDSKNEMISQRTYLKSFDYYLKVIIFTFQYYANPSELFSVLKASFNHPLLNASNFGSYIKASLNPLDYSLIGLFLVSIISPLIFILKKYKNILFAIFLSFLMGVTIIRPDNEPIDLISYITYPLIFLFLGISIYLKESYSHKFFKTLIYSWILISSSLWTFEFFKYQKSSTSYVNWTSKLESKLESLNAKSIYTLCESNIALLELNTKKIEIIHLISENNNFPKSLTLNELLPMLKGSLLLLPNKCSSNQGLDWIKGVDQESISQESSIILDTYDVNPNEKYFLLDIR